MIFNMNDASALILKKLEDIENQIANKSCVKSIQSGRSAGGQGQTTITINEVNPDKCLVFVDISQLSGVNQNYVAMMYTLSATKLVVTDSYINGSTNIAIPFNWQIIEFY